MIIILSSIFLLTAGALVVVSGNPVTSVFWLITCFINIVILLFIYNFNYLSLLFLIVYVGAVAILFVFVKILTTTLLQQ